MNTKVFLLILAAVLLLGILIFRYLGGTNQPRIDPHAAGEIEKAKRR
jgi:hypothetical protein